jgi:transcriptional regulator with XRE-family HTH domain
VDNRKDVHDFLVSRRAKVSPAQAGLPTYDDKRRVPGLRREEVASLAGVSFDYYARLERGNLSGVSEPVLESLARALQLDEAERGHLFDLARMAATRVRAARARKPSPAKVRPSVASILTGMTGVPAYVRNARMDILAANDLCYALYTGVLDRDRMPVNLARYVFLDHRSTGFFLDWETIADDVVGTLRGEVGRNPTDHGLSDLVGELCTRSDAFAIRWGRHNVRIHRTARKRLHNPVVGDIELTGDALELPGEGLTLIAYTADVGSQARDQLNLLANWSATERHTSAPATAAQPEESDTTPTRGTR